MRPVLVLYATREGHTRQVAERVTEALHVHGFIGDVVNVKEARRSLDLSGYAAAILAASVHLGRHEREILSFVKRHRRELEGMPAAFLSVSLSEAGAEDERRAPEERARAARDVQHVVQKFFEETGWRPERVQPVAGALLYRQYGRITRWLMKRIAEKEGGDTDTAHDHVYTDWDALEHFVEDFAESVRKKIEPEPEAAPRSGTPAA